MKLLIGVLLLLVTFVAAAMWQRSWRADAHAQRDLARSGEQPSQSKPQDGEWGRVIVGRPSGADPAAPLAERPAAQLSTPTSPANSRPAPSDPAGTRSTRPGQDVSAAPSPGESKGVVQSTRDVVQSTPVVVQSTQVVVKSGESLSTVCQAHYGTSRQEVVQALALYNNMKDPDTLREGQTLTLPPLDRLLSKNPR